MDKMWQQKVRKSSRLWTSLEKVFFVIFTTAIGLNDDNVKIIQRRCYFGKLEYKFFWCNIPAPVHIWIAILCLNK